MNQRLLQPSRRMGKMQQWTNGSKVDSALSLDYDKYSEPEKNVPKVHQGYKFNSLLSRLWEVKQLYD